MDNNNLKNVLTNYFEGKEKTKDNTIERYEPFIEFGNIYNTREAI